MAIASPRGSQTGQEQVGVGSCAGYSESCLIWGSCLVCPVFFSQNLNWVCVGGSTKVHTWEPPRAPRLLVWRLGTPRLTEAGSAKQNAVNPVLQSQSRSSLSNPPAATGPPRLRVGFPAKHRLWRQRGKGVGQWRRAQQVAAGHEQLK